MDRRQRPSSRVPGGLRGRPLQDGGWLVALPAWGERAVRVLIQHAAPALAAALQAAPPRPTRLLVWTDRSAEVREALSGLGLPDRVSVEYSSVPGPDSSFASLSACHRRALQMAGPHDRVLLLTADMVVSREVVATCDARIAAGVRAVCCVGVRALEDAGPPVGASGRELLAWAWDHRHPMTRECTWPEGRSYDVWRMYFERGEEVAARVFLPHPLAVVPQGRDLRFSPTIDVNLLHHFSRAMTYLITSPDEGAAVEVSPADKEFLMTTTMRSRLAAGAGEPSCPPFIPCTAPRHRMFFEKRVVIRGAGGDCGDGEVVGRILG